MNKILSLTVPGSNGNKFTVTGPDGIISGGLKSANGKHFLANAIELLLIAVVILALIVIIYSGIQYILSQGDKTKIQVARNRLIYAIVGMILAFLSFSIISIIGSMFGVKFF
jgi:hypothetical protein